MVRAGSRGDLCFEARPPVSDPLAREDALEVALDAWAASWRFSLSSSSLRRCKHSPISLGSGRGEAGWPPRGGLAPAPALSPPGGGGSVSAGCAPGPPTGFTSP